MQVFRLVLKMNVQQAVQPRSSANGFSRRRVEKDMANRMENKFQPGKSNPSRVTGVTSGGRSGDYESPARDRLVYLTTCLIGHHVEVQVKNGSVFSGIFHATNADKDIGVVLKMARLTKDTSLRGQKAASDTFGKAPSKTLIISAHELVQVIAKDVPVTREGISNELQCEKQREIMLDSYISQSRHVEVGRELAPWVPDEGDMQRPELENIFDSPWAGSWDQFKVNEKLFGVKSTFNEELYTTKLERGPRMRELEEEAMRIAREIEGEDTRDLHLAEERGTYPMDNFDIDEETRFSSVLRGVDDSGYEDEDGSVDTHNTETFGDATETTVGRSFADVTCGKIHDASQVLSSSSSMGEIPSSQTDVIRDVDHSGSLAPEHNLKILALEDEHRVQEDHIADCGGSSSTEEIVEAQMLGDEQPTTKSEVRSLGESISGKHPEDIVSNKAHGTTLPTNSHARPGSSTSSTSDSAAPTSISKGPRLSPSSSVASSSSEKSTLNPNAKEFKLNPNAKSFSPSRTPFRPGSPAPDTSFYYPTNMPAVPHMHGMPVGIGIGPSYAGPQPVLFNPQAAMQSPQAYYPANGPQYGQQMIVGHPRQVMYMPGYPAEMAYKGRDF